MTVAKTSLENWFDEENQEKWNNDRERIYHLIKQKGPVTRKEVSEIVGKPLHSISGRFTELKNRGKIEVVGTVDGEEVLKEREEEKVIFG